MGRGVCEKLLEASSICSGANDSVLQNRPITGQGQAHQQQWQDLWYNVLKKGGRSNNGIQRRER